MKIIDSHCDTMNVLADSGKRLAENDLHIDMKRLSEYDGYTQVFAVFIAPEYAKCAKERTEKIIRTFRTETAANGITVCRSPSDLQTGSGVKAILSLEGGEAIETVGDIEVLYNMGVRMIAPTWNSKNRLACGIVEEEDTGLSPFGREAVHEMNRLGIIVDVSHLSEKSFYDVCAVSKMPMFASHSNLRSVCVHKRNLTDEQFLHIVKSGGAAGINFHKPFFGGDIADIVKHIDKCILLGGEDNIVLGSDFDGTDCLPNGIDGVQDMGKIIKTLPYSTEIREKIAFRNFLRVFEAHHC